MSDHRNYSNADQFHSADDDERVVDEFMRDVSELVARRIPDAALEANLQSILDGTVPAAAGAAAPESLAMDDGWAQATDIVRVAREAATDVVHAAHEKADDIVRAAYDKANDIVSQAKERAEQIIGAATTEARAVSGHSYSSRGAYPDVDEPPRQRRDGTASGGGAAGMARVAGQTVYYSRAAVVVTGREFRAAGRTFVLSDLRDLRTVRSSKFRFFRIVNSIVIAIGIGIFVALTTAGPSVWPGWLWATEIVIGAAGAATALGWAGRVRSWQLWATHQGQAVQVYETTDTVVFNQTARALLRAIERGPAEPPPDEETRPLPPTARRPVPQQPRRTALSGR